MKKPVSFVMNKCALFMVFLLFIAFAVTYAYFFVFPGCLIAGQDIGNHVEIGEERINVELARTPAEMQQGLMFRKSLCDDCGMLFVFESEGFHSFWMKNTLIPLDMLFIDANLTVVDVIHAVPCEQDPCQIYAPKGKALYVLEVNGGRFDERLVWESVVISIDQN
jgi:uncharacterized membrane protein (UPF0127 family)